MVIGTQTENTDMDEWNARHRKVAFDLFEEMAAARYPLRGGERMRKAMETAKEAWSEGMTDGEWLACSMVRLGL